MLTLILISLTLALIPALVFAANLRAYAPPPVPGPFAVLPPVSVLIPAQNEEAAIGAAVRSSTEQPGTRL